MEMILKCEENGRVVDVDYLIELSILKVRRMQITGIRDERQRLLVIETLQSSIERKIAQLEEEDALNMDSTSAFLSILQEAIRKLGLARLVRFGVTLPDADDKLPRLKLPSARRNRDLPPLVLNDGHNMLSELVANSSE